jgi:hypothetical protein
MPKSIVQSNTGAGAIQIGQVGGNVIIHMSAPASDEGRNNDRREAGLVLGSFAAMFLGISLATPHWTLQATSYFIACGLTIVSGVVLATSNRSEK